MRFTENEATYFYWHCTIAALLIEQIEERNRAVSSHIQRAIRMASETAVGEHGVQYASQDAIDKKPAGSKTWRRLGLTREHVVPVSVITARVLEAHGSGSAYTWNDILDKLTQEDLRNWEVMDSDSHLERHAPLSAVIAAIVRKSTVLAWITKDEDKSLSAKGLVKSMPADSDGDVLARYRDCGIDLLPLS